LAWLIEGFEGHEAILALPGGSAETPAAGPDFDDMVLQPGIELAVLVAASGMHSLLLRGSPGTGKSMLAARLPSILPDLDPLEHVEAMRIHSTFTEKLPDAILCGRPPYRAPHHQASAAAVLGSAEMPGEISLAHGGVLFLDELTEFRRDLLESLREPLETGCVHVSRSRRKVVWSARIMLVAACNNCPCGWFGSSRRVCTCGAARRTAYWSRLSGPILDRIDLQVNMPEPDEATAAIFLRLARSSVPSKTKELAARVLRTRARAAARNVRFGVLSNRDLPAHQLVGASGLEPGEFARAVNATFPRAASSRAVLRALRVARTLADLDESETIRNGDLEQAWAWQAEAAARQRGETL
jgi:magnesium chelatase family protein